MNPTRGDRGESQFDDFPYQDSVNSSDIIPRLLSKYKNEKLLWNAPTVTRHSRLEVTSVPNVVKNFVLLVALYSTSMPRPAILVVLNSICIVLNVTLRLVRMQRLAMYAVWFFKMSSSNKMRILNSTIPRPISMIYVTVVGPPFTGQMAFVTNVDRLFVHSVVTISMMKWLYALAVARTYISVAQFAVSCWLQMRNIVRIATPCSRPNAIGACRS